VAGAVPGAALHLRAKHIGQDEIATMAARIDTAREAFIDIYQNDRWGLAKVKGDGAVLQRFADLIQSVITRHKIRSVAEFGCGFWSYARLLDWTGLTYDGYDVVPEVLDFNIGYYGAPNIRFHQMTEGVTPGPADLLISKDVLQHLPVEDVAAYLAMFRERFSFMLITNDIYPETNTNGPIAHGGYRAIRLDLPPFNLACETLDEWEIAAGNVTYRKRACLLRGR